MLKITLAPHCEAEADPSAADYALISAALGSKPLYHQWRTYQAKAANIVVNSYNTGTGKTKAALLRLLDLNQSFKRDSRRSSNVLFLAPTNELMRQHQDDVKAFVDKNKLNNYIVLGLDARSIKEAGKLMDERFNQRQGLRLDQILSDPEALKLDDQGHKLEGKHSYVLVTNPDIFYYGLYTLGNPHEQKLLFRKFLENFSYIIIDEFHYYNAKQLANFLFFLTLCREWGYFNEGRQICLLTATPVDAVNNYLNNLNVKIERIEPLNEPGDLATTPAPALALVELYLESAEALSDNEHDGGGLTTLASRERAMVNNRLKDNQHGVFISSALWRVNRLYEKYGGIANPLIGRITGPQSSAQRQLDSTKALIMATPTVDIGYNFGGSKSLRQNIDFALFDARTSDEFIQRLGRAGRVLGKEITGQPSTVWAVVPDKLITELKDLAGQTVERRELNARVKAALPPKNGLYSYIKSGAIAEAFLPIYKIKGSLATDDAARVEEIYSAVCQVYGANNRSYDKLKKHIKHYNWLTANIARLIKEDKAANFEYGTASMGASLLYNNTADVEALDRFDEVMAQAARQKILKERKTDAVKRQRQAVIEEYYRAVVRFNFRDNFQPPQVLAHDSQRLLAGDEYTIYSALHLVQNFEAEWSNDPEQLKNWRALSLEEDTKELELTCEIRQSRQPRLNLYFHLNRPDFARQEWEEKYVSRLAATNGFTLRSDNGLIPAPVNRAFEGQYITFYAVPDNGGAEYKTLLSFNRLTALYTTRLQVDFADRRDVPYLIVLGSAALQLACEDNLRKAKHVAQKIEARGGHIFDWEG